jgi:hypothetical protein
LKWSEDLSFNGRNNNGKSFDDGSIPSNSTSFICLSICLFLKYHLELTNWMIEGFDHAAGIWKQRWTNFSDSELWKSFVDLMMIIMHCHNVDLRLISRQNHFLQIWWILRFKEIISCIYIYIYIDIDCKFHEFQIFNKSTLIDHEKLYEVTNVWNNHFECYLYCQEKHRYLEFTECLSKWTMTKKVKLYFIESIFSIQWWNCHQSSRINRNGINTGTKTQRNKQKQTYAGTCRHMQTTIAKSVKYHWENS